jgi:hypothetical protein
MLHSSNELEVLAYDLGAHKVLRQTTIAVPKVHGTRATDGLAVSPDGQMLAYVEGHEPCLVLLLSTKDFSEIRRTTALPFSADDHQRMFAGFDGDDQLALASNVYRYGKPEIKGIRFLKLSESDLRVISDTKLQGIV